MLKHLVIGALASCVAAIVSHPVYAVARSTTVVNPPPVVVGPPPMTTFYFTGQCTDCAGQGLGTLVVQNYFLGSPFNDSEFVSFNYTSNLLPAFAIKQGDAGLMFTGAIGPTLPAPANVSISAEEINSVFDGGFFGLQRAFNSTVAGPWTISTSLFGVEDFGPISSYSVTQVPEPLSASLVAVGLAGFAVARMRGSRSRTG